jgi:subtilisin family serine protease
MRTVRTLVLALAAMAALPAAAAAQLAPPASPSGDVPGQVIVQFRTGVSASARGAVRGAADVEVVRAMRQDGQQLLEVQPGQSVAAAIRDLEADPRVVYAQPNHVYHATAVPNDPLFGQLWGQLNTGQAVYGVPGVAGTSGADTDARLAWDRTTGSRNILVAVTDTGIAYDHPDLAANIWSNPADPPGGGDDDGNGIADDVHGANFCPQPGAFSPCDGSRSGDPFDQNGHGTHVAGSIGAVGDNGVGVAGMNWQVSIMAVRVLNADGSGTSAAIADGFDYAGDHGARVVNVSLGGSGSDDPAERAAIHRHPDTLYVVAAGNDGSDNDGGAPHVPCNITEPNLVCVAATTQDDALAGFSNVGTTSVDLGAPGTNVLSTWPSYDGINDGFETSLNWINQSPWDRVSGTSAGGSFSVADSPSGNYAPNVNTSLTSVSALPLAGGTCRVLFDLRLDSERIGNTFVDGLRVEISPNNVNWSSLGAFAGSTGGQFVHLDLDLPTGTPMLLRFRFSSNGSDQRDGAYLDNVKAGCMDHSYDATDYAFLNGTSMATPQVTGAAALALSLEPRTTVGDLKSALMSSGDELQALKGKTVSGRRLNVLNLLNTISPPPVTTPPPGDDPAPGDNPTPGGNPPIGGGGSAPPRVKTLAEIKIDQCKQSGRGRTLQLKCRLRDSDALVSSTATIKKGRRTVATGAAKLTNGALSVKLKRKLRKGRYTLSFSLRGAAGVKRTLSVKLRI